jgi:amidophosphoribosyltransferase
VIDDSIVRGTTSRKLVETLRKAGATEVHFRISSPVVKYPCYFGIDTPYRSELIGARMTVEEMNEEIGSDSLGFLSQKGLVETISQGKGFCLGCFSGVYPVAAPMETPKERMD